MNNREDLNRQNDLNRASEHLDRAADHTGDAARHTAEAMEAGASGVMERTKSTAREAGRKIGNAADRAEDAVRDVGRKAGAVAERISNAEVDVELEHRVDNATENALQKVGNAIRSAAPVVGRGAEVAVGATGSALSAIGAPLGVVIGKIAGRVGGWWNSAAEAIAELPAEEQQACRVHFEAYELRPADLTFDQAMPSYALGYVAARNPDYQGRRFEDIEPDLRHGFGTEPYEDYDSLRDFTRFGYERGSTVPGGGPTGL